MPGDCEVLFSSDCEVVEPHTLSLSRKWEAFSAGSQEDMNLDGAPVKAPSAFRRRIMSPTPQQRPLPPLEGMPRQMEVEDQECGACEQECEGEHGWTARDRTMIAKMEQYLNESDNMKVEIEELELLLGPEDSEVDSRYMLMNARRKKRDAGCFKSSGRRVRVISWLSPRCDG